MAERLDALRGSLARTWDRHVAELTRLVEAPSVSAHGRGIDEAVAVCTELLEARGLLVEIHATPGHPVIVAKGGRPDGARMLFYEHYDVQPPDPEDGWTVPPFTVTERDGRLYGRGTADTKGHIVCRLAAIDAVREVHGDDPCGYTFLIEGEEEIGSPNLGGFIAQHADDLRADACLWEFGGVDAQERPLLACGLKGIATLELTCSGPAYDAHSSLGAVIQNPLYRLASAIASLRDAHGRVLVDGFYDAVDALGEAELAAIAAAPDLGEELREQYGVWGFLGGARGSDLVRRLATEPCINVNGIHGGYGGPGSKTVLPAEAMAKLDVRLVPSQDPTLVVELIRRHLDANGFSDVGVQPLATQAAGRTPLDDPFVALVTAAARDSYGTEPVLQVSSAGTGPAGPFRDILGVPLVTVGCAYPGSRVHAPDEHVRIRDLELGRVHSALVVSRFGDGIT